jgi:hypothetical protein
MVNDLNDLGAGLSEFIEKMRLFFKLNEDLSTVFDRYALRAHSLVHC